MSCSTQAADRAAQPAPPTAQFELLTHPASSRRLDESSRAAYRDAEGFDGRVVRVTINTMAASFAGVIAMLHEHVPQELQFLQHVVAVPAISPFFGARPKLTDRRTNCAGIDDVGDRYSFCERGSG